MPDAHEVHSFIACSTCEFAIREPDPEDTSIQPDRPCPQCGWTLLTVGYVIFDGGCTVNVEWDDADSAPLNLADTAHALLAVQTLIESEVDAEQSADNRRTRLNELRLTRRQEADDGLG